MKLCRYHHEGYLSIGGFEGLAQRYTLLVGTTSQQLDNGVFISTFKDMHTLK